MVTPSSTWLFESEAPLVGCGIDVERVERFRKIAMREEAPWTLVFSGQEISHALGLPDPAAALCAAFCAKEAFFKAIRAPFEYTGCELLLDHRPHGQAKLRVSPDIAREHGISGTKTLVKRTGHGTMMAMVYVFGEKR